MQSQQEKNILISNIIRYIDISPSFQSKIDIESRQLIKFLLPALNISFLTKLNAFLVIENEKPL